MRTAYCLCLALVLLARRRHHVSFAGFEGLGWIFIAILMLAALWPAFLALAAPLSWVYFSRIRSLSEVRRKANTVPLILALLALTSDAPWLIKCTVCQVYFSAAYEKWRTSGWAWTDGQTLMAYLWRAHLLQANRPALWLAHRPGLCRWLSRGVLIFETTIPLVLVFPGLGKWYFLAALAFHGVSSLCLRIHYLLYFGPALLWLL